METDQRFEEARLHEQAEDFARQEKILKLISTELTRNTTRVVEMAVKNEIQNSVLPSLENITKNEVKGALSDQIGISLIDVINRVTFINLQSVCNVVIDHMRRVYQWRWRSCFFVQLYLITLQTSSLLP
jgi:hypothetical protein